MVDTQGIVTKKALCKPGLPLEGTQTEHSTSAVGKSRTFISIHLKLIATDNLFGVGCLRECVDRGTGEHILVKYRVFASTRHMLHSYYTYLY